MMKTSRQVSTKSLSLVLCAAVATTALATPSVFAQPQGGIILHRNDQTVSDQSDGPPPWSKLRQRGGNKGSGGSNGGDDTPIRTVGGGKDGNGGGNGGSDCTRRGGCNGGGNGGGGNHGGGGGGNHGGGFGGTGGGGHWGGGGYGGHGGYVRFGPRRTPDWYLPRMRDFHFRQTHRGATMTLQDAVLFATDSAVLRPRALETLQPLADFMADNPGVRVAIDGHTDSRGTDAHNQDLSERRAESVRAALVDMGAERARFSVVGYGESQPVATNSTREGMRLNRRVEVTLLGQRADRFR
jgi:outer membrane protein OmpA-like peptidoglycan-associated protein